MTGHSPHLSARSPRAGSHPFQWPSPTRSTEISLKEILEKFCNDPELLKHVLMAKAEEDKKQAAEDGLKTERARIQLKQLDLEFLREQARLQYPSYPPSTHLIPPSLPPPPPPQQQQQHHTHPAQPRPPQPVLSRFSTVQSDSRSHPHLHPSNAGHHHPHHPSQQQQQVASPVSYPHSAHPLCQDQQVRSLPRLQEEPRKRPHNSMSSDEEPSSSHKKVMEALKAKIQRTGHVNTLIHATPTPTSATPTPSTPSTATAVPSSSSASSVLRPAEFAPEPPQLPKIQSHHSQSPSTPSPRSAGKPILPPIDTSVGRIRSALPSHPPPPVSISSPADTRPAPTSPSNDARKDTIVKAEA